MPSPIPRTLSLYEAMVYLGMPNIIETKLFLRKYKISVRGNIPIRRLDDLQIPAKFWIRCEPSVPARER